MSDSKVVITNKDEAEQAVRNFFKGGGVPGHTEPTSLTFLREILGTYAFMSREGTYKVSPQGLVVPVIA